LLCKLSAAQRLEFAEARKLTLAITELNRAGKFREALPRAEQALKIRRKLLGADHVDTVTSLNDLAILYQSLGDCANAEPLYRQALEIDKEVLGETHPEVLVRP
jgi:tetratricopeptide (TPR) repeat protein